MEVHTTNGPGHMIKMAASSIYVMSLVNLLVMNQKVYEKLKKKVLML